MYQNGWFSEWQAFEVKSCAFWYLFLVRQNYLPPPRCPNFRRSREGYGRYDFPLFSRIWVSTVDLGTQSSILLSGGGGREFCVPCVPLGAHLGVSLAALKGVSKRMAFKMATQRIFQG